MAQGEEHEDEDLDIWLIKMMCEHVGVLKDSFFMHSLFYKWSIYLLIYLLTKKLPIRRPLTEILFFPFFFFTVCISWGSPETQSYLRKKKKNQCGCQIKNACIKPYNRINKRSELLLTNSFKKTTTRYCNNYSKINEERKQRQTDLINAHIIQYRGGLSSNIF